MPCNNCQASTNVPCGGLTPNDICNGKYTASDCVIYAGVNLSTIDTVNGDTFTAVVNNINDALNNIVVGAFTANNGLTKNTSTNVQLGGTLLQDTTINADTYLLDITGIDPIVFQVKNTATGVAGYFESAANSAVVAQSTNKPAVYALTTGNGSTIEPIIVAARAIVSGSVSVGLGASIDTRLTRDISNAMTNGSSIITYWSAVVPDFESTWELHTVTTNTLTKKMTMLSTGQLTLDKYITSTSFASASGASVGLLNVDNAGNVFVGASSSGFTTADNGLTASTSINAQLGSTTNSGSPLLHDTYINTDSLYTLFFNGSITGAGSRVVDIANTSTGGALKVTSNSATEPTVLIENTTLNSNINALKVTGNGANSYAVEIGNSTGDGLMVRSNSFVGINSTNTGTGGIAVYGINNTTNGSGGEFQGGSLFGWGVRATCAASNNGDFFSAIVGTRNFDCTTPTTPLVLSLVRGRVGTEVPVNNTGCKIEFQIPVSNSLSPTKAESNYLISKLTTVDYATRTSQFEIWGVNNGAPLTKQFSIAGSGQLTLDDYGNGTFTGTPVYNLGVTSTGTVIETLAIIPFRQTLSALQCATLNSVPVDITDLPAPGAGFAWEIITMSVSCILGTTDYDFDDIQIIADTALNNQFSYNYGATTSATSNIISRGTEVNANNSGGRATVIDNKKMIIQTEIDRTVGDGTFVVYGTARKITL